MKTMWDSLPDKYFATCLNDEDVIAIVTAMESGTATYLLAVVEKLTTHIAHLQDQIHYRYNGCCCDYDHPGDVCLTHEKEEKQWWQLNP